MPKTIKVSFVDKNHSSGRGVGYYSEFLKASLLNSPEIKITDKDPDVIHYPFFDPFYHSLPDHFEKPTVVTVHDVTPLVMSDRYPKGIKGTYNLFRQWLSLRKVSAIITDSECSKKDIVKYLFINPEKIFVTHLAIDPLFAKNPSEKKLKEVKEKYHLPDKFVLNVGPGPNPNKNLPSLAEVTERIGIPLVIVGGGMTQEIKRPIHPELIDLVRLEVYNHLIRPGFVPTDELVAMYKLATLFVQASYYEGFGMPLLQAMTAETPLASSRASSLKEVYHQEAITFSPKSLSSIEKAVAKALNLSPSKRQKQIQLAKEKSKEFTWAKTAKKTIDVYKSIL